MAGISSLRAALIGLPQFSASSAAKASASASIRSAMRSSAAARSAGVVRLHPSKPYFVFAPMVEEPFVIAPGKPFESRYRYVVYDGKVTDAEIAAWPSW